MIDPSAGAEALVAPLAARVPGLTGALDPGRVARRIERDLLPAGGRVHRVSLRTAWYRADGSCSLKFQVMTSDRTAGSSSDELTVLTSVPSASGGGDATWSLFPADPELPTLAEALELPRLAGEEWPSESTRPVSVELVRHSRQGAAVLRYKTLPVDHPSQAAPAHAYAYAKVYPDELTGPRVQRFLESCDSRLQLPLPDPLGYSRRLRLGLLGALPGQPMREAAVRDESAPDALRKAGEALATLHGTRHAEAPARTAAQLAHELETELAVVRPVWPHVAAAVESLVDPGSPGDGEITSVLCHGDFTPSQVLLAGGRVTGIIDPDTACWGEAAMDLGRFLAHLDLLIAKRVGASAGGLAERLADSFLTGYHAAARAGDESIGRRVARYRAWSLATTALHACRQLKQSRLDLALALLRTSNHPTTHSNRKAPHAHLV